MAEMSGTQTSMDVWNESELYYSDVMSRLEVREAGGGMLGCIADLMATQPGLHSVRDWYEFCHTDHHVMAAHMAKGGHGPGTVCSFLGEAAFLRGSNPYLWYPVKEAAGRWVRVMENGSPWCVYDTRRHSATDLGTRLAVMQMAEGPDCAGMGMAYPTDLMGVMAWDPDYAAHTTFRGRSSSGLTRAQVRRAPSGSGWQATVSPSSCGPDELYSRILEPVRGPVTDSAVTAALWAASLCRGVDEDLSRAPDRVADRPPSPSRTRRR